MQNELEPLAISSTEAARLLGVSRPTIYELINKDNFPAFRVGRRVLISVNGLQNWIDEQASKATQE